MKRKVLAILVPALLMAGAANAAEMYNISKNIKGRNCGLFYIFTLYYGASCSATRINPLFCASSSWAFHASSPVSTINTAVLQ